MNGEHQRRREAGQQQINHLEVAPLTVAALPSEREDRIEQLAPAARGLARVGAVRNQPGKEENRADR